MKILKVIFLFLIIYHVKTEITGCKTGQEDTNNVCIDCDTDYVKKDDGSCEKCEGENKIFFNNHCFTKIEHCANDGYKLYRGGEICEKCNNVDSDSYIFILGKCRKYIQYCEE